MAQKSLWTAGGLAALTDGLDGEAALLDGAKVALFTNAGDIEHGAVIGDLTQPTTGGLSAQTVAAWDTTVLDSGTVVMHGGMMTFETTNATGLPLTLYGYAITKSDDTLLCITKFPSPVDVTVQGQTVWVEAILPLDPVSTIQGEGGVM